MNQTNRSTALKNEQTINLLDLMLFLLSKWKWFLISVLFFVSLAWFQYARSPLVYFRKATVVIKDPSNTSYTAEGLNHYDNYVNKVNVANELLQFQSKKLMLEVVSRVHADISYQVKDGFRWNELFTRSPIAVRFIDATPERSVAFTVTPKNEKEVIVSHLMDNDDKMTVTMNDTVAIGDLHIVITPTHFYKEAWLGESIHVRKNSLDAVASHYQASLGIRQEESAASIITLSLKDNSPVRAEDILNMLITVYNEDAIKDKNQVAVNTAEFINERLIIIGKELGDVEANLESFKRDNKMVDISTSANMFVSESQKYSSNAIELETQLQLAQYIKEYLTDARKETDLIPTNTGISDMNIESQITKYNSVKLKRDRLINESSDSNPVVEEMNNTLHAMKQNIIRTVDNMIVGINMKLNDALSREKLADSRVASIPTKERNMLSIERQQKIKELLYVFLLNRREENALTQAMVDNNARVIDSAESKDGPIFPQRNRILMLGVLIGLAIPTIICLLILFLDTRIHSRKDIEGLMSIPFLGEIPLDKKQLKRRSGNQEQQSAVSQRDDDMVSEAFRVLRTNMAFMSKKDKPTQVITFTSFNEGAGKTFISRNLALSLVRTKKRVIILDLDIRKGTLSRYFNLRKTGISDFLADSSIHVDDIIQHHEQFDIISSGTIAPNPAELLMDERLDELVSELRSRYDYIIADSVPVGVIADATITNRIADLTVFVVRAGKLDRRQLPDIERLYNDKKLTNMAIVLNGADFHSHYGYGYYSYYGNYSYGAKKSKKFNVFK